MAALSRGTPRLRSPGVLPWHVDRIVRQARTRYQPASDQGVLVPNGLRDCTVLTFPDRAHTLHHAPTRFRSRRRHQAERGAVLPGGLRGRLPGVAAGAGCRVRDTRARAADQACQAAAWRATRLRLNLCGAAISSVQQPVVVHCGRGLSAGAGDGGHGRVVHELLGGKAVRTLVSSSA